MVTATWPMASVHDAPRPPEAKSCGSATACSGATGPTSSSLGGGRPVINLSTVSSPRSGHWPAARIAAPGSRRSCPSTLGKQTTDDSTGPATPGSRPGTRPGPRRCDGEKPGAPHSPRRGDSSAASGRWRLRCSARFQPKALGRVRPDHQSGWAGVGPPWHRVRGCLWVVIAGAVAGGPAQAPSTRRP